MKIRAFLSVCAALGTASLCRAQSAPAGASEGDAPALAEPAPPAPAPQSSSAPEVPFAAPAAPPGGDPAYVQPVPAAPPPAASEPALAPPPAASEPAAAAPAALGEVLAVEDHLVTVSLGSRDGLAIGSHVAFLESGEDAVQWERGPHTAVVGRVVNLAEDRARVEVGMFEDVQVGAKAQLSAARLSESRKAPPRPDGVTIVELGVRPFLPLERVSVGAFADLSVTYLPELPMYFRAEAAPVGARIGVGADAGMAGGSLSFGYDQRFVGIGLGAGTVLFRKFIEGEDGYEGKLGDASPRFLFLQHGRVGSRDGMHGQVTSAFALVDESWELAWLRLAGQFPVGSRAWVGPRFVFGRSSGLFSAEAGVRILTHGNGGAGSLFVRPLAGVAGTVDLDAAPIYANNLGDMLFGPMLGLDVELRL